MEAIVPKIFIVTNHVNLMLSRKLKGQGFASAIPITIVNSVPDLPFSPETNSYLIIEGDLLSQIQNTPKWHTIFIITNFTHEQAQNICNVVITQYQNINEILPRVIQNIISVLKPHSSLSLWHSTLSKHSAKMPQINEELINWAKKFRLQSLPAVVRISQFIDSLNRHYSLEKSAISAPEQCALTLKFDGMSCECQLTIQNEKMIGFINSSLEEIANGPWFNQLFLKQTSNMCQVEFRFSIISQQMPCIYFKSMFVENLQEQEKLVS